MTDAHLDELRRLAEDLRQVFADERRAISTLDHERLSWLADRKRDIAARLGELRPLLQPNADARALFEAVRVEARATALLASSATRLVQQLLGTEHAGYDRRARGITTSAPLRTVKAY